MSQNLKNKNKNGQAVFNDLVSSSHLSDFDSLLFDHLTESIWSKKIYRIPNDQRVVLDFLLSFQVGGFYQFKLWVPASIYFTDFFFEWLTRKKYVTLSFDNAPARFSNDNFFDCVIIRDRLLGNSWVLSRICLGKFFISWRGFGLFSSPSAWVNFEVFWSWNK